VEGLNKMLGLQPTHILIVLIIALVFFAPSRLPDLVRAIGKSVREFRGSIKETDDTLPGKLPEK
jgi:sec-independent protein translocase protein TatA